MLHLKYKGAASKSILTLRQLLKLIIYLTALCQKRESFNLHNKIILTHLYRR